MPSGVPRPTADDRFWTHVEKTDDCWLWTAGISSEGYGVFALEHRQQVLAHRFAHERVRGPIPKGLFVCHTCDNPRCVRPDHLFIGDHAENMRDMYSKGRGGVQRQPELLERARRVLHAPGGNQVRGERHRDAKLTEAAVLEIRRRGAPTRKNQLALAAEYGVSERQIRSIVSRQTWRHVL